MKKFFTLLIVLTFSVVTNAQTKLGEAFRAGDVLGEMTEVDESAPDESQQESTRRKIRVDSDERIMGYYTTDDLYNRTSYSELGTFYVADLFTSEVIGSFVTGEITRFRFALGCRTTVYAAYIYAVKDGVVMDEPLAYIPYGDDGSGKTLQAKWNDVELDEPITIEDGYEYLIGFQYEQTKVDSWTGSGYSLCVDLDLEREIECDYFYYSANGSNWYAASGYGALCIQAVVRGGRFLDDDLSIRNLVPKKYAAKDSEISFSVDIRNIGNNIPESYKLSVAVDGEEKGIVDTPITPSSYFQTANGAISIEGVPIGSHTLSVSVAEINGVVPEENTADDEVEGTFVVYGGDMPDRQMHLIENFTSVQCGYCPLGHEFIESMQKLYPDKYAWIAIHSIGMGEDEYALNPDDYLVVERFIGCDGYPSATFDRAPLTSSYLSLSETYCPTISYGASDVVAERMNTAIEDAFDGVPAFATVNIDKTYDPDTRELTITVSGEGSESTQWLLEDNRLTIYLTEDGLEGIQEDYTNGSSSTGWYLDYTHNNVLRAIVNTYEWGDDINWTSETTYENTVTTTLDPEWDDSQIYITAFISGSMAVLDGNYWYYGNVTDGMVNNTNRVKATDVPAGISAVTVNPEGKTHTYYTTDGRQLSSPIKGVNVVKSSDGTVKKIYVK